MKQFFDELKKSLIRVIRERDTETDIFFEEIKGTDKEHGIKVNKSYYFIELIPKVTTVDKVMTDLSIFVDIAFHDEKESNAKYFAKIEELDEALRPVIRVDSRSVTINNISYKIVDSVLHVSFFLELRIAREVKEEGDLMEEMVLSVKGE